MSEISYESIHALASVVREGDGLLDIVFECPVTGETARVVEPVQPVEARGEGGDEEPFRFSTVRVVNDLVRDILGYNAAFAAATAAVESSLDRAAPAQRGDGEGVAADDARRDALFRAFQSVMHRFAWDGSREQWVAIHEVRGLGNELQRQLKLAPVESGRDRDVLERMMLDVATVDEEVSGDEADVLLGFIDRDALNQRLGSAARRLSQADLRQTSDDAQTRETLFMLAMTVAFADHHFDEAESDRVEFFGKGLGISEHRQEELLEAGKRFFLEQYLVRRFAESETLDEQAREDLVDLAEHIGYDEDGAELAFERFRQAHASGGSDGFSFGSSW